jgi:hypothetical protein
LVAILQLPVSRVEQRSVAVTDPKTIVNQQVMVHLVVALEPSMTTPR